MISINAIGITWYPEGQQHSSRSQPMSKYHEYQAKPTEFLALTGSSHQAFEALLRHFRAQYEQWMATHRLDGQGRGNRKSSDYQNSPLPTSADKRFFILSYLKSNNLQIGQGALFGMSQPKANRWIHCLHPILHQTLSRLGELPARAMDALTFAEQEDQIFFHDGTAPRRHPPILRPGDPVEQHAYYSGKKTAYGQKQRPDQSALQDSLLNRYGRRQKA
jgi:hypothetical protein